VLLGMALFGEPADIPRLVFIAMIVVGLKLVTP
jgi:multidrug transporter EmrE-like cation transporter